MIIPMALILSVFAKQVLLVWSGDPEIIIYVAPILSIMVIGTLFNGFMNIPYMLQLAYGWTSLTVIINTIATLVIVPLILLLVPHFGAISAAWIWLLLNAGYAFIGIHFMYRRLLPDQKANWYKNSIFKPLVTGLIVAILLKSVLPSPESKIEATFFLIMIAIALFSSVAFSTPLIRNILSKQLRQIFKDFN
jgi:O-antigen/teichoic acid export membrane protein